MEFIWVRRWRDSFLYSLLTYLVCLIIHLIASSILKTVPFPSIHLSQKSIVELLGSSLGLSKIILVGNLIESPITIHSPTSRLGNV